MRLCKATPASVPGHLKISRESEQNSKGTPPSLPLSDADGFLALAQVLLESHRNVRRGTVRDMTNPRPWPWDEKTMLAGILAQGR